MAKRPYIKPQMQIIIPYQTFYELLECAQAVDKLEREIKFRDEQILALRKQLVEVFDVIHDLREEIRLL